MIVVRVRLDGEGVLSSFEVTGHAAIDGGVGQSVVCAAVTGIVRACADAVASNAAVGAVGAASRPGELVVNVTGESEDGSTWLQGVTDVLLGGVGRIARDAPDEVELIVDRE
ncbi:MAG: ribosomal-processing cysteine protease Prp [Spirochaetota bacterium]